MAKRLLAVAMTCLVAAPAVAQDLPTGGIMDLPQHGRSTVTSYMAHNQVKARRDRATASDRTARTCANAARMRARGSSDPRLVQLKRLCRRAGH